MMDKVNEVEIASSSSQHSRGSRGLTRILVTDCGSTTTKAILFERFEDGWRLVARGEAPTTVEKPVADVTIGVINACREVEEIAKVKLLAESGPPFCSPATGDQGIDLYLSTSSAGGGLQMIVAGVIGRMTAESAERAALGAGAIVMDTISLDDGREPHERVEKIRHIKPDIILIAGGTEGGSVNHPLDLCETILQADPQPRFGDTLRVPVIYAANSAARSSAEAILGARFSFVPVENIRPSLERENLSPARDAIHDLFLHHVMSHAPGYGTLLSWSPEPIIPTPAGFGFMVLAAAEDSKKNIMAVDIGGATTDVFSAIHVEGEDDIRFNRTVSANLGMSYSVGNVLLEAGIEKIGRWLPFEISEGDLINRVFNKMIRPTTIPQTIEDLLIEQAICREALRLAISHHRRLAQGLKGAKRARGLTGLLKTTEAQYVEADLIIGSGGVLSHAPDRMQAAMMLIDSFEPIGVTELAVDSVFMMPHLGVLSTVNKSAARQIFYNDCLVPLGTVISASGSGAPVNSSTTFSFSTDVEYQKRSQAKAKIGEVDFGGERHPLVAGEVLCLPLAMGATKKVRVTPASKRVSFGAGLGEVLEKMVHGGVVGVIIDTRGRGVGL